MKTILYIVLISALIFFVQFEPIKDGREARILFSGDMMFDRTIRTKSEASKLGYNWPFSCLKGYLKNFDLVVANLEGPITRETSTSAGTIPGQAGNTSFTFSPDVVKGLFENNVRVVNLGNNHSFDRGRVGAENTKNFLSQGGVLDFGSPLGPISMMAMVRDFKITFVNFNQFIGMGDEQLTVDAIKAARPDSDFVFVYTHWGEEYVASNEYQRMLAHTFIDAGADMVIGSHPHVIQEREVYKGKWIFYSLGNFIFDQYFSEDVRRGGGVEVNLSSNGIDIAEHRFNLERDGRTCLVVQSTDGTN